MLKVICSALLFAFLLPASNVSAECDTHAASDALNHLLQSGLVVREMDAVTVRYLWKGNWNRLTEDQKYNMALGIGEAERCLHGPVTVRIRYAGREVAKSSPSQTSLSR